MTDVAALELRVLIVGLGAMGRGIARVFAAVGSEVTVLDADDERTAAGFAAVCDEAVEDPGAGRSITAGTDLAAAVAEADLLVEAIVEDLDVKRRFLGEVREHARPELVVASNTSSLSIGAMGAAYGDPGQVLGLHFFNPPMKMELVEVVVAPGTDPSVAELATSWVSAAGKTAVTCQDSPNFIVNRVCRPLYYEAQLLSGMGHEPAVIDVAARRGLGHRVGPLELLDHAGIHTHVASSETAHRELTDPRYRSIPLSRRLVAAGFTGKAAGRGFYDHQQDPPRAARERVLVEPPTSQLQVAVEGPDRGRLVAAGIPSGSADAGAVVLYACGATATDADVEAVRDRASQGAVVVESSDGRWLSDLPAGAGWLRLHGDAPSAFAEVVDDPQAAITPTAGVDAVLAAIGAGSVHVLASPGLIVDRLRACLINEAVVLLEEGLAASDDIDLALRLGMNHPAGPLQMLQQIGFVAVRDTLLGLARDLGDPRYRPTHLLSRSAAGEARR